MQITTKNEDQQNSAHEEENSRLSVLQHWKFTFNHGKIERNRRSDFKW